MKSCWMFPLLLALTVDFRGNPQGMVELPNVADVISEPSELNDMGESSELNNYMDGEFPDFMVINMNGEPLPYTIVGDGSDLLSKHQARSLYDHLPAFGKKVVTAARRKMPRSKCTKEGWEFTCCVTFPGSKPAEGCFRLEIDRFKLDLTGGLIINKKKLGAYTFEGGKFCAGIPLTLFTGCIHVYQLKWDYKKKEVNICVCIIWMSLIIIDYGCLHFDRATGFSVVKVDQADEAGLVKVSWDEGKPRLDYWHPKGLTETSTGFVSIITGQTIKFGDWKKPYMKS